MRRRPRQKDINLLEQLSGRKRRRPPKPVEAVPVGILAALVIGAGALHGGHLLSAATVRGDIELARGYLSSPSTQQAVAQADAAARIADAARLRADAVALPRENLDTYPTLSSATVRRVYEIAGSSVGITSFAYDQPSGLVSFTAQTDQVARVPSFVAELRASGLFSALDYRGYDGSRDVAAQTPASSGAQARPRYVIEVSGILAMPSASAEGAGETP
ncbi:MAG: hypothetical protein LBD25_04470 [Coriobacteriales bacterium]|jgi:hypothetical protein|nr:hypothetical protein [Coriobacteriales bacterium]